MKKIQCLLLAFFSLLLPAFSQTPQVEETPSHVELRTMRTAIIDAIIKGDIDAVLPHVHPNVVVTWQNSEVCRGREGLKTFFERMGRESFKGYKVPPTPDELSILHGENTGVSFGKTVAEYNLLGKQYEIESRWTATVVKEDGKWMLASYHISMNTLDNPLLTAAKNALYIAGGSGLVVGLLIGFMLKKSRTA